MKTFVKILKTLGLSFLVFVGAVIFAMFICWCVSALRGLVGCWVNMAVLGCLSIFFIFALFWNVKKSNERTFVPAIARLTAYSPENEWRSLCIIEERDVAFNLESIEKNKE